MFILTAYMLHYLQQHWQDKWPESRQNLNKYFDVKQFRVLKDEPLVFILVPSVIIYSPSLKSAEHSDKVFTEGKVTLQKIKDPKI